MAWKEKVFTISFIRYRFVVIINWIRRLVTIVAWQKNSQNRFRLFVVQTNHTVEHLWNIRAYWLLHPLWKALIRQADTLDNSVVMPIWPPLWRAYFSCDDMALYRDRHVIEILDAWRILKGTAFVQATTLPDQAQPEPHCPPAQRLPHRVDNTPRLVAHTAFLRQMASQGAFELWDLIHHNSTDRHLSRFQPAALDRAVYLILIAEAYQHINQAHLHQKFIIRWQKWGKFVTRQSSVES